MSVHDNFWHCLATCTCDCANNDDKEEDKASNRERVGVKYTKTFQQQYLVQNITQPTLSCGFIAIKMPICNRLALRIGDTHKQL